MIAGNFPDGKYLFKGTEIWEYPGYTGGNQCVENLSMYREEPVFRRETDVIDSEGLAFDIERHVGWDTATLELRPFTYSMMIDGYYPITGWPFSRKYQPSVEEFEKIARGLGGFIKDEETSERFSHRGQRGAYFLNPDRNMFINWSVSNSVPPRGPDTICIGVVQNEPVADLRQVTDEIVPYAVSVFNRLSPTSQISDELVKRSIETAVAGLKIIPQRRN